MRRRTHRRLVAAWLAAAVVAAACASSPRPAEDDPALTRRVEDEPARPESAAPIGGAACGDRTCGVDELCVPQGFCSGIRPPMTDAERAVTYRCVAIPHACAESPDCGCAGDVCLYGGCAGISRGVVSCVCA